MNAKELIDRVLASEDTTSLLSEIARLSPGSGEFRKWSETELGHLSVNTVLQEKSRPFRYIMKVNPHTNPMGGVEDWISYDAKHARAYYPPCYYSSKFVATVMMSKGWRVYLEG